MPTWQRGERVERTRNDTALDITQSSREPGSGLDLLLDAAFNSFGSNGTEETERDSLDTQGSFAIRDEGGISGITSLTQPINTTLQLRARQGNSLSPAALGRTQRAVARYTRRVATILGSLSE